MYIKVHAFPESKIEKIQQTKPDTFEVHIKEPRERNLANKKIATLLHQFFASKNSRDKIIVRLISGHTSNHKIFSIDE